MVFTMISGWIGMTIILIAYLLVSTKKIRPNSILYQSLNFIGALGVIVHSLVTKAIPAAILFIAWAAMALIYLVNMIKKEKEE